MINNYIVLFFLPILGLIGLGLVFTALACLIVPFTTGTATIANGIGVLRDWLSRSRNNS